MVALVALCRALRDCQVEFVIVGGVAVSLVSRPRYTADIDAVLWDVDERLPELLDCLAEKGFRLRAENAMDVAKRSRVLLLEDANAIGIDLSMGILPFERWMIDAARNVEASGTHIPVASPEALIVMKAIAWRAKDIEDIRELAASNPNLDRDFVIAQVAEYSELLEMPERAGETRRLLDPN